ncbi:hypothetical protein R097_23410 [Salmonella enterica subsp. enterica serovar Schwarzengrund]|nr:hypothetical protein CHC80_19080 [Salmonella enterica subsp. enterica serovar Saintpaul]EAB4090609.1 hypothetical protein [Salmonella enterica]EBK1453132.1 hypothetical protein [Salmonella enterica subsp. enterica serovar Schwarzengrund]EAZ8440162.1 hypothetical protein [Salmonella enterica]EBA4399977.1 hypothetical protein [Salmonella enterica]
MALVLAPEPVSISGFQVVSQSGPIGTARGLSSTTRQSKPISFGICSRFVSASSKLKSVACPFGYQRPADG